VDSKDGLIFVLDDQKDDRKGKPSKKKNGSDNCKTVKAHSFGANLDATRVRRSRNVRVVFHVRQPRAQLFALGLCARAVMVAAPHNIPDS